MNKSTILTLCFTVMSTCLLAQETFNATITHDGLERSYVMYVPDSYEAGNPLVMNFHGYTSTAVAQLAYGDFRPLADEAGFLLVHPQGTVDNQGNTHWNVGWGTSTVDDVGFVSALIDSLDAEYAIDLSRIYSTGMSNGGFLSYELACELSERIAAIASVTGTMNIGAFNTCDSQHPMPVMEIHGTNDGTVPYNGDFWIESSEDVVAYWAGFNNIMSAPVVTALEDIDMTDGATVDHWVYSGGDNGSSVELYKVFDGAHTWPGSDIVIGVTNQDFSASDEIWRFFSQYDINGLIEPNSIEDLKESMVSLYPNPSSESINIDWKGAPCTYKILDSQAITVRSGKLRTGLQRVALAPLPHGTYHFLAEDTHKTFVIVRE